LWRDRALTLARAARELGLKIGRDLHLVGWCLEERYAEAWVPEFEGEPVAPAVTWSARTLGETAMARLAERRENPDLPALRVKIPVSLRLKAGG
ncbi:MAG: hypothetical protein ACYTGB_19120, partial [Planctomycetota bacterium]